MREGQVDPWSGQRPAFPMEGDSEVMEYLHSVRAEAQELARNAASALSRPTRLNYDAPIAVHREEMPEQPQDEYILNTTKQLFGEKWAGDTIDALTVYEQAKPVLRGLPSEHPEQCTSLATWKQFSAANPPVPVDHINTFRLFKYLVKWIGGTPPPQHYIWAWSLLIRTPDVLDSDEIATLRDVCRAIEPHFEKPFTQRPLAIAFIYIVGTVYGQADMLKLIPTDRQLSQ